MSSKDLFCETCARFFVSSDESGKCPVCGQEATDTLPPNAEYCPNCHKPKSKSDILCPGCGFNVVTGKVTPAQSQKGEPNSVYSNMSPKERLIWFSKWFAGMAILGAFLFYFKFMTTGNAISALGSVAALFGVMIFMAVVGLVFGIFGSISGSDAAMYGGIQGGLGGAIAGLLLSVLFPVMGMITAGIGIFFPYAVGDGAINLLFKEGTDRFYKRISLPGLAISLFSILIILGGGTFVLHVLKRDKPQEDQTVVANQTVPPVVAAAVTPIPTPVVETTPIAMVASEVTPAPVYMNNSLSNDVSLAIIPRNMLFERQSNMLSTGSQDILNNLVDQLHQNAYSEIVVTAYTAGIDPETLISAQANAVRTFLIEKGFSGNVIKSEFYRTNDPKVKDSIEITGTVSQGFRIHSVTHAPENPKPGDLVVFTVIGNISESHLSGGPSYTTAREGWREAGSSGPSANCSLLFNGNKVSGFDHPLSAAGRFEIKQDFQLPGVMQSGKIDFQVTLQSRGITHTLSDSFMIAGQAQIPTPTP